MIRVILVTAAAYAVYTAVRTQMNAAGYGKDASVSAGNWFDMFIYYAKRPTDIPTT